jgi:hypothetical protein
MGRKLAVLNFGLYFVGGILTLILYTVEKCVRIESFILIWLVLMSHLFLDAVEE